MNTVLFDNFILYEILFCDPHRAIKSVTLLMQGNNYTAPET